jgi:cytochrome b pre-mRNA-processing protein 3
MFRFLFPRLTAESRHGEAMFDAVTRTARAPNWYVEGQVPDTLDGRFAILATVAAFLLLRLERSGNDEASVALTERFIEVMESEHRELGLGDPTLGRTVRKLVGSLSRRVDLWREAIQADEWNHATRDSVYPGIEPDSAALAHTETHLSQFWARLQDLSDAEIAEGTLP